MTIKFKTLFGVCVGGWLAVPILTWLTSEPASTYIDRAGFFTVMVVLLYIIKRVGWLEED